jgi:hypothetical protein
VYHRGILFKLICIYPGYTRDIPANSCCHNSGIFLKYTRYISALLKSSNPSCSRIAVGIQLHTDFGFQGCLMSITARGGPIGTRRPGPGSAPPPPRQGLSLSLTSLLGLLVTTARSLLFLDVPRLRPTRRTTLARASAYFRLGLILAVAAVAVANVALTTVGGVVGVDASGISCFGSGGGVVSSAARCSSCDGG